MICTPQLRLPQRLKDALLTFLGVAFMFAVTSENTLAQGSSAPQALIERVLEKADDSYLAKRYTQPRHNNAYDRYQAVLMISPGNKRALMGLQRVEEAYIALIDGELDSGSLYHAKSFLAILEEYYPHSDHLAGLRKRVAAAEPASLPSPDVNDLLIKEYLLNPGDLRARNAKARKLVIEIATRVATTKEAVLILARNDSEGRWVYQVMNEATPEYRVRGDIQLRNRPAIHLLEPL